MTNGTSMTVYSYDAEERITAKTESGIGTVTYTYDIPVGNGAVKEAMTMPDGVVQETVYDAVGRISSVSDNQDKSVHYVYNANGSRQAVVYADGTREDYTYDGASRVSTITHTDRNGTQLDYYEYTYDAAGNLTEEKNRYGSTRYTYDANRRLKSVTEPEGRTTRYTYDTAGNRATKEVSYGTEEPVVTTYTYNFSNQLMTETTGDEATTYTYDGNGNLVTEEKTVAEEESVIRYTYDAFNRMTGYEADGVTATYSYNAEDYHTGKNVIDSSGNKNIQYFYDGSRVIMEADDSGSITSHNLYGTHLAGRSVQGEDYYYLYNAHGDVVMLLDAATGAIAGTYRYDAFGNVILETGTPDNSVTYAGYQYDEETGLYYLNARYYDSATARFLTEDTYRGSYQDPLSLNRYTYCHNNPLIYWDPTGHAAKKYEDDHFYSLATRRRHPRCKIGSAGSYVYQMELMLEKAGYRTGNCKDGIFDGQTLRAVRMFQEDNGLKVTGIVEQRAWAFLEIQSQLKNLENRYNRKLISEEEYLTQVYGLKKMAGNVPYKYDDKTLEKAMSDIYAIYNMALSIELALLETQVAVLTMGVSELIGDGADLIQDVYDAVVNKSPGAVGSIVFDSACLLVPDGPLNYADNVVDDVGDVAKKAGKQAKNVVEEVPSEISRGVSNSKILWGNWNDYEKVTVNGQQYARVGDRLYSHHAVNRMQPSGNKYGFGITQAGGVYGRSVSPNYVEFVINSTKPIPQENGNLKYVGGTIEVITNKQGAVVTIMTK